MSFDEMLALPASERERLGVENTPREILQQPQTWIETFGIVRDQQIGLLRFLADSGLAPTEIGNLSVALIGAGTSDYVGRALEALIRKEWKCHVRAIPSTDLFTEMDEYVASSPPDSNHLWISFSRSGDSFEGVKVLEKALGKYPHIRHLIVTCSSNGQMAKDISPGRENVYCIELDDKVNDRGLAMTSSFSNMIIAGQCLAHIANLESYEPIVSTLSNAASKLLPQSESLARKTALGSHTRVCFLGSGPLKATADESSLKVLELTAGGFSVMSESFLGLRHGPLSWLDSDSLVVGFLSNSPETRRIEIGLLDELKRKSTVDDIIVLSPQSTLNVRSANDILSLDVDDNLPDAYRPPLDVIFGQCFGLYACLRRGLKPDNPSADGKISRVVKDIEIGTPD
ncbi:SIS domain-containing protein [soil metagenome]